MISKYQNKMILFSHYIIKFKLLNESDDLSSLIGSISHDDLESLFDLKKAKNASALEGGFLASATLTASFCGVKSQMPIGPEHAFKSAKSLILQPFRTIYKRTFQCETPCTSNQITYFNVLFFFLIVICPFIPCSTIVSPNSRVTSRLQNSRILFCFFNL